MLLAKYEMNFKKSAFFYLQSRFFSLNSHNNQINKGNDGKSNHYDSLKIKKSATQADVKTAYYELSKLYHPDKNQGCDESSRKFREVTEAYEVLGNVKTRRMYDKGLYIDIDRPSAPDDPMGKFYRSRDIRRAPPTPTGRTPIYDFDEWSRNHYGKTFRKAQQFKRYEEWREEQKVKAKEHQKMERLLFGVAVLTVVCVYLSSLSQSDYDTVVVGNKNNAKARDN